MYPINDIKVVDDELVDEIESESYSRVRVKLAFRRHHHFYSLTLIAPIVLLTVLTPLGLIMPGKYLNTVKTMNSL